MKWILFLIIGAIGAWAYFNVDFSNINSNAQNTIKQEKTLKKFFESNRQNQNEINKTLQEDY